MDTYAIKWYNDEKTIILEEVMGRWAWQDIFAMMKEQFALMDTVDHTVHVILIAPDGQIPVPADALLHLQKIVSDVHPHEGLKVLVGAPKLIEALFSVIGKVYRFRDLLADYAFAESMDEALAIIEKAQT